VAYLLFDAVDGIRARPGMGEVLFLNESMSLFAYLDCKKVYSQISWPATVGHCGGLA
jgi:hypothetical protein